MRNIMLVLILLVGFVFVNSLLWAGDKTGDLKQKLEKMADEYAQAAIAGNIDKIYSFYTDDAASMPNYGTMIKGKENMIKQETEMRKAGFKIHSFDMNISDVWASGDIVCEIGTYTISLTLPGEDHPVNDNGKYMNVWQKSPANTLKLKYEIWNTDMNPWQMEGNETDPPMHRQEQNDDDD